MSRIPLKRLRYQILERDGFKCTACGRSTKEDGVKLEIDHITPWSKGGTHDTNNLKTLCRDCNRGKGDVLLDEAKRVKSNNRDVGMEDFMLKQKITKLPYRFAFSIQLANHLDMQSGTLKRHLKKLGLPYKYRNGPNVGFNVIPRHETN